MSPARRLTAAVLALVVGALGMWVATRLVWLRVTYESGLRGVLPFEISGADIRPELGAVALLGLAGVAALVATGGWARRVVGALLVAAGVWTVWSCVSWWTGGDVSWFAYTPSPSGAATTSGPPGTTGPSAPPADAVLAGVPTHTAAPLLGAAGGLLLAAAGAAAIAWAGTMSRLGARYTAPGAPARVRDRDSEWWNALDAGDDPTVNRPPADPRNGS